MKKSPLRRKTPLRKISKKRATEYRKYLRDKERFLGNYRFCECTCGNHDKCLNKATEVHHIRGRIGELLLDQRYWLSICQTCHAWIHANGKQARELGLLK